MTRRGTCSRLKSAPTGLMLSDTALESLYQPSPVYFWNLERTNLVPDLRYVPLTMGEKERLDKVVDWQLAGPTTWLAPAVAHRPNVQRKDRVAPIGDRVVVNLSSGAASDEARARIASSSSSRSSGSATTSTQRSFRPAAWAAAIRAGQPGPERQLPQRAEPVVDRRPGRSQPDGAGRDREWRRESLGCHPGA